MFYIYIYNSDINVHDKTCDTCSVITATGFFYRRLTLNNKEEKQG